MADAAMLTHCFVPALGLEVLLRPENVLQSAVLLPPALALGGAVLPLLLRQPPVLLGLLLRPAGPLALLLRSLSPPSGAHLPAHTRGTPCRLKETVEASQRERQVRMCTLPCSQHSVSEQQTTKEWDVFLDTQRL